MDQWAEWTECPTVPEDESSFSYHNVPYRYRSRHCSHNRYDDDYHTHHDFDADLSHHDADHMGIPDDYYVIAEMTQIHMPHENEHFNNHYPSEFTPRIHDGYNDGLYWQDQYSVRNGYFFFYIINCKLLIYWRIAMIFNIEESR